jgi:hypothetical protein
VLTFLSDQLVEVINLKDDLMQQGKYNNNDNNNNNNNNKINI